MNTTETRQSRLAADTFIACSDIAPRCACGNEIHTYHCSTSHAWRRDFALVAQCYDCGAQAVLSESDDAKIFTALSAADCRARHEAYTRS